MQILQRTFISQLQRMAPNKPFSRLGFKTVHRPYDHDSCANTQGKDHKRVDTNGH